MKTYIVALSRVVTDQLRASVTVSVSDDAGMYAVARAALEMAPDTEFRFADQLDTEPYRAHEISTETGEQVFDAAGIELSDIADLPDGVDAHLCVKCRGPIDSELPDANA